MPGATMLAPQPTTQPMTRSPAMAIARRSGKPFWQVTMGPEMRGSAARSAPSSAGFCVATIARSYGPSSSCSTGGCAAGTAHCCPSSSSTRRPFSATARATSAFPTTGVTCTPARVRLAATTPPIPPQPMTATLMRAAYSWRISLTRGDAVVGPARLARFVVCGGPVNRPILIAALFLASCTAMNRHLQPGDTPDLGLSLSEPDEDAEDLSSQPLDDLSMSLAPPDYAGQEAGYGAYSDLGIDRDAAGCANGQVAGACANPIAANVGCTPNATDPEICGNGLDDNCNGLADEGCSCTPGAVQRCFLGPPGKRNVGGCTDGAQTCVGSEFATWG